MKGTVGDRSRGSRRSERKRPWSHLGRCLHCLDNSADGFEPRRGIVVDLDRWTDVVVEVVHRRKL
jgi:hypothetical protein